MNDKLATREALRGLSFSQVIMDEVDMQDFVTARIDRSLSKLLGVRAQCRQVETDFHDGVPRTRTDVVFVADGSPEGFCERLENTLAQETTRVVIRNHPIKYDAKGVSELAWKIASYLGADPQPKATKVVENGPATVVFWSDGTKTVSKCSEADTYKPLVGKLLCALRKVSRNRESTDRWESMFGVINYGLWAVGADPNDPKEAAGKLRTMAKTLLRTAEMLELED